MRQILPAVAAVLALAVVGAALPHAQGHLDPFHLQRAPVAKQAPWPAWAHGGPPLVASSPATPQQPVAAAAPSRSC